MPSRYQVGQGDGMGRSKFDTPRLSTRSRDCDLQGPRDRTFGLSEARIRLLKTRSLHQIRNHASAFGFPEPFRFAEPLRLKAIHLKLQTIPMHQHGDALTFNHFHAPASTTTNAARCRAFLEMLSRVTPTPSKAGGPSRAPIPRKFASLLLNTHMFVCPYDCSRSIDFKMSWYDLRPDTICGTMPKAGQIPDWNSMDASLVTDLGLDIHLGGRAAKALHAEVVRELTTSDLALLSTERGIQPTHVQRITDRHHALARCLASGMSATEAGLCTGYTASRISVLRGDPAFEELIAFYRSDRGAEVQDLQQKFTALAKDATTEIQERLELAPEGFGVDQLLDVVKLAADRSGNGPQSKTTNLNVNVNLGDRMKAARERVALTPLPVERMTGASEASHEASLAPLFIEGEFSEVPSTRKG